MNNTSAIIVAGGRGLRMKDKTRKQYLNLAGRPILAHTILNFHACPDIREIILAVPEKDLDFCRNTIVSPLNLQKKIQLVPGGSERQDSVYKGLLAAKNPIAAIHDGVRPFIRPAQITETIKHAADMGACILGIPAFDTLKQVEQGIIKNTLERNTIWLAQTPQTFQYDLILSAHESARNEKYTGTDDASLVERMGKEVKIIEGSRLNIKITAPDDMVMAGAIYKFFI